MSYLYDTFSLLNELNVLQKKKLMLPKCTEPVMCEMRSV